MYVLTSLQKPVTGSLNLQRTDVVTDSAISSIMFPFLKTSDPVTVFEINLSIYPLNTQTRTDAKLLYECSSPLQI